MKASRALTFQAAASKSRQAKSRDHDSRESGSAGSGPQRRRSPGSDAAPDDKVLKALIDKLNSYVDIGRFSVVLLGNSGGSDEKFCNGVKKAYISRRVAGFADTKAQMRGTVIVGIINVLATFIAIAFVDKLGRKPIMYAGFVTMGLAMITVAAGYLLVFGLILGVSGLAPTRRVPLGASSVNSEIRLPVSSKRLLWFIAAHPVFQQPQVSRILEYTAMYKIT